jgi:hypothetical protein
LWNTLCKNKRERDREKKKKKRGKKEKKIWTLDMILKIASIYSIKCTAMESMNTWQKIYEEN